MKPKFNLPKPNRRMSREPLVLSGPRRILMLSDIHVPFHDVKAIAAAIDFGQQENATDIWLNGDLLDFYSLSSFEKDPRERRFADELEMAASLVDAVSTAFPKANVWAKMGNHENRFDRYMTARAPELLGVPAFSLERVLSDAGMNVNYVDDWRVSRFGKLFVVHGHEIGRGGGGGHPARWLHMRTQHSSVCGHFHRTSEFTSKDINGKIQTSWSLGCLCDLSPDYMQHNQWNHGFAFVDVRKTGTFHFQNLRIVDGVVY
jgi:predicted phosphodiesterase